MGEQWDRAALLDALAHHRPGLERGTAQECPPPWPCDSTPAPPPSPHRRGQIPGASQSPFCPAQVAPDSIQQGRETDPPPAGGRDSPQTPLPRRARRLGPPPPAGRGGTGRASPKGGSCVGAGPRSPWPVACDTVARLHSMGKRCARRRWLATTCLGTALLLLCVAPRALYPGEWQLGPLSPPPPALLQRSDPSLQVPPTLGPSMQPAYLGLPPVLGTQATQGGDCSPVHPPCECAGSHGLGGPLLHPHSGPVPPLYPSDSAPAHKRPCPRVSRALGSGRRLS